MQRYAGIALSLGLAWALAGCSSESPSITPFAIPVDLSSGPVLVELDIGEDDTRVTVPVDTMSPLTVIDSAVCNQPPPAQRRRRLDLAIMAARTPTVDAGPAMDAGPDAGPAMDAGPDAGPAMDPSPSADPVCTDRAADPTGDSVPRARFRGVNTLDIHPCRDPGSEVIESLCRIGGLEGPARAIRGILGSDVLSRYAVRFDFGAATMSFFPDIAGNNEDRSELCESVFPAPFYGGGTMVVGGTEISFSSRRLALGTCFFDSAREAAVGRVPPEPGPTQGIDGLFVVSTGLGTTVVTESAYGHYRSVHSEAATLDSLPQATLYLPAGPVQVRLGTMTDLALVGEVSDKRGPCNERYANDFLTRCHRCTAGMECPCGEDRLFCQAGTVVELRAPFEVAVVPDDDPTLQALREELRPGLPEVSGILGVSTLESLRLDVDYPNNRVLARCMDGAACVGRPAVLSAVSLCHTRQCVPAELQDPSLCPNPDEAQIACMP